MKNYNSEKVRSLLVGGAIAVAFFSVSLGTVSCNGGGTDTDNLGSTITSVATTGVATTTTSVATAPVTTTTTTTTSTSTATTTTTTMSADTTKVNENEYIEPVVETTVAVEPVTYEEPEVEYVEPIAETYYFEGTYYSATSMGYTSTPYGASGNLLTSGYSVASNYFPFGTRLWIESDYISGEFIVQDCGGMAYNVVDFYYWDNSNVPSAFAYAGRIPITVTVLS